MAQSTLRTTPAKATAAVKTDVQKHLKTSAIDHLYKKGGDRAATHGLNGDAPSLATVLERMETAPPEQQLIRPLPSSVYPAMTVKEFAQGDYLEPGDVILMTRLGSFFAWLLKFVDKSDFAHVAMVFQTPRQTPGIDETFLIETSMGGVEIVSLSQFLEPKKVYADTGFPPDFVVGVKRLETEWADGMNRQIAANRMLHFIENDEYNFRLLAALASPKTRNLYFKLRDSFRGKAPAIGEFLKKGGSYMPSDFICSGFVQYAFVDMVKTAFNRGLIDAAGAEAALKDVIFVPGKTETSEIEELLACTPNNLAQTEKLKWKCLIHRGAVFNVTCQEDVTRFFKETLPGRLPKQNDA